MLTAVLAIGTICLGSSAIADDRPGDEAARAAPRVIVLLGRAGSAPIYSTNWFYNQVLVSGQFSRVTAASAASLPGMDAALFWNGADWGWVESQPERRDELLGKLQLAERARFTMIGAGRAVLVQQDQVGELSPGGVYLLERLGVEVPGLGNERRVDGAVGLLHAAFDIAMPDRVSQLLLTDDVVFEPLDRSRLSGDESVEKMLDLFGAGRAAANRQSTVQVDGDRATVSSTGRTMSMERGPSRLPSRATEEVIELVRAPDGWRIARVAWGLGVISAGE